MSWLLMTALLTESLLRGYWKHLHIKVQSFFFPPQEMIFCFILIKERKKPIWVLLQCVCAVTTVDSGSKALEFLGFHEDDEEQPTLSDSPTHQVFFFFFLENYLFIWVSFYLLFLFLFYNIFFFFLSGSGSEPYYYRLLYARHDRLWSA